MEDAQDLECTLQHHRGTRGKESKLSMGGTKLHTMVGGWGTATRVAHSVSGLVLDEQPPHGLYQQARFVKTFMVQSNLSEYQEGEKLNLHGVIFGEDPCARELDGVEG